jgi:hypothetical protein
MAAFTGVASAPPQDDDVTNYPMLREILLRAEQKNGVSDDNDTTQQTERDDALSHEGFEVQARNQMCAFCEESVGVALKPVAVLPCGHAYHVMCGRSLLFGREGTECTESLCHKTEHQVQADTMRRTIEAAVSRGDFDPTDLKDPILRRDIMQRVNELMEEPQRVRAHAPVANRDEDERSEAAYEGRWNKTSVAQDGFSYNQKRKLLAPFTANPLEIRREDVTLARLYDLEEEQRRKDQEDEEDESSRVRLKSFFKRRPDETESAISMQRFVDAGLTIADIYFKLELKSWTTLCDLGFMAKHFTNYKGGYPITAVADLYAVDYNSFKSDLDWSIDDVVRTRASAQELANVGLDFKTLYVDMNMQKQDLFRLGYTPRAWSETLRMDKMYLGKPLNITSTDLNMLRWSETELAQAFALSSIEARRLGISQSISAPTTLRPETEITDAARIERKLALARQVEAAQNGVDEQQQMQGIPVLKRLVPENEAKTGDGWGRNATQRRVTVLTLGGNTD